jgi:serine/threonine protein kinase
MSLPSPDLGKVLGHYRILEQIGEGGMGIVYRAHDMQLDRDVALKVLPAGTLNDASARARFRKEALAPSHAHSSE